MKHSRILSSILASALLGGVALAQTGPAITTLKVGVDGGDTNDYAYYGQTGGIAAYSMATTSCNPGTAQVQWTSGNHPVIGTNLYRIENGRMIQLGQSWLKHGFCAVNEPGCGTCQTTPCGTLGIGCADTYWATLNDGQGGGPKFQVNAATGSHVHPYPTPTGPSTIRGRLQVQVTEIDPGMHPGASFVSEGQYISAHTATNGNGSIANSWRRVTVSSVSTLLGGGATVVGEPAVYAWKATVPDVTVFNIFTAETPTGSGLFTIGTRAVNLGTTWRYDYIIQNVSSDRSGYSFSVPVPDGTVLSNIFFRDVDYHSGEPYSNTDWVTEHTGGVLTWRSTETFATNQNANALRWGTMYTFGFECPVAPLPGNGELRLFKPGAGSDVWPFSVPTPTGAPQAGTAYCFGDGLGTFCPCFNFGDTGRGCGNGYSSSGARLVANGAASVGADTLQLSVTLAVPNQPGLFFQGNQAVNGGNGSVFGDGLRCAGGGVIRLEVSTATGTGNVLSTVAIGSIGLVSPGDTKYYQYWYRDPLTSPCGALFNLTNGLEVDWTN